MGWHGDTFGFGHADQIETSIYSPELGRSCVVRIRVPRGAGGSRRFPVAYAQDGEEFFRPRGSPGTLMTDLSGDSFRAVGQNVILVGVDHGGLQRADEYSPFEDEIFGGGRADDYVQFLTGTLKPGIDALLPVSRRPEDTAILGSSLGGLFALYAKFTRPDVFGAAVVFSPAVSFADSSLGRFVERQTASGRIHLDVGTTEFGTGSPEYVRRVRAIGHRLVKIGYEPGATLNYVEIPGGTHCERSWETRLPLGLDFALGGTRGGRGSRPTRWAASGVPAHLGPI